MSARPLLNPKATIVYGPVQSRRLGRSLGINLLPTGRKVCTFDCLYCQYGWTDPAWAARPEPPAFPSVEEVQRAVASALRAPGPPPEYLTFSGNGEPTLHPRFPEMVEAVTRLRDTLVPGARTAVLSNSSRATVPDVRAAVARLDLPVMKLDAGSQEAFARYNRPIVPLGLDEVVEGLRALARAVKSRAAEFRAAESRAGSRPPPAGLVLQSLFCGGPDGNLGAEDVASWLDAVVRIAPATVQIYTLARGAPSDRIAPAPPPTLEALRLSLRERGVAAEVY